MLYVIRELKGAINGNPTLVHLSTINYNDVNSYPLLLNLLFSAF